MLTSVIITGADESIDPIELLRIYKKFPFVEFGILYASDYAKPRYPGNEWLYGLMAIKRQMYNNRYDKSFFPLAVHLCKNAAVEGLFKENPLSEISWIGPFINRLQLNTPIDEFIRHKLIQLLFRSNMPVIIQDSGKSPEPDSARWKLYTIAYDAGLDLQLLFDESRGQGLVPNQWPVPDTRFSCGYAGGLTPDNLHEQLLAIGNQAGANDYWIDMETGVRSKDNKTFDYNKVIACLKIAESFLTDHMKGVVNSRRRTMDTMSMFRNL